MNWKTTFIFKQESLYYNRIPVNNWSERVVELPIAFNFLAKFVSNNKDGINRILELGNVLYYYENSLSEYIGIRPRRIVDKFEQAVGVDNVDCMDLQSEEKYQVIVSVSTVEHIGQGVEPSSGSYGEKTKVRDLEAPLKAIAKIYDLLLPGGKALITVPFGRLTDAEWFIQFSKDYQELLVTKYKIEPKAISTGFLKRIDMEIRGNNNPQQLWVEAEEHEVIDVEYSWPLPGANAIAVLELIKLSDPFTLNLDVPSTPLVYESLINKTLATDSPFLQTTLTVLENLRKINLIFFPDWREQEEFVINALEETLRAVLTHPDRSSLNLFIDTNTISPEDATLLLSSVSLNLLMSENLDIGNSSDIFLIENITKRQWKAFLTRIHARIYRENEKKQTIAQVGAEKLPAYAIARLNEQRVIQLENGSLYLQPAHLNH